MTVAELELRQRVRSRKWLAAIIVWFALIGVFTLLMAKVASLDADSAGPLGLGGWDTEPDCGKGVVVSDDKTSVDGCTLPVDGRVRYDQAPAQPGWQVLSVQVVCSPDKDGVVSCWVAQWWTLDNKVCYDTGTGPACFDDRGKAVESGAPQPDLGFECTNNPDGSAVCSLPPATYDGETMIDPPKTCTVRADRTASCEWVAVDGWTPSSGPLVFGLVVFFVLGLGMLVTPALTASSINGDRNDGTLATLQVTTLSATQIAAGKLVAAWGTMLAFLVAALPWIITAVVIGKFSWLAALGCGVVLMGELAVLCAVGLGWSALVNRTSGSNLLSYLTVMTLSTLTVVFMALLVPLTEQSDTVEVWRLPKDVQTRWDAEMDAYWRDPENSTPPAAPFDQCTWFTETRKEVHPEKVWWMLAANPFIMVADAAPEPKIARTQPRMYEAWGQDPMFLTRTSVAWTATAPPAQVDECYNGYYGYLSGHGPGSATSPVKPQEPADVRVWPWSLSVNLLLGGLFFAIAVWRLKVPYSKLPKGTRVA